MTSLMVAPVAAPGASPCDTPRTQADLNACAGNAAKQADAKLNDVYATLAKRVSPAGRQALRAAQRAWITYRDAQCGFDTLGTQGGSIHAMMVASCLRDLTDAQAALLQKQINCPEGDTSCGGQ